jgi:hypothetical protein
MALLGVVAAFLLPAVVLVAPIAADTTVNLAQKNTALFAQPSQSLSTNWAGYATYDQANHSVTKVSGSWVQPRVTCPSNGTQYAAFWVGIDGFTTQAVEQDGTLVECHLGVASYTAWWELYPTNAIQVISSIVVHPGNTISASVVYHAPHAMYTMTVDDLTTGKNFTITAAQAPQYAANPEQNSAECVIERPAEISHGVVSLLHLADFGTVQFSTCTATVGGSTSGVGNFAPAAILYMVGSKSTQTNIIYLASPGGPTNIVKWAFTTTWQGFN